jgi:Polyphosphate kinase C-terminal domain 2
MESLQFLTVRSCENRTHDHEKVRDLLIGWSLDQTDHPRCLLSASGSSRAEREHPSGKYRWKISRAHTGVFIENGGAGEVYLGSADIMHRNLDRRIETLFPIEDLHLRKRVRRELLDDALSDNTKIRSLQSDGTYSRAIQTDNTTRNFHEGLMMKYQASNEFISESSNSVRPVATQTLSRSAKAI